MGNHPRNLNFFGSWRLCVLLNSQLEKEKLKDKQFRSILSVFLRFFFFKKTKKQKVCPETTVYLKKKTIYVLIIVIITRAVLK